MNQIQGKDELSKAINRDAPELSLPGRRAGDAISSGVNACNYSQLGPHRQVQFGDQRGTQ